VQVDHARQDQPVAGHKHEVGATIRADGDDPAVLDGSNTRPPRMTMRMA
jgi:hypothetical protein